MARCPDCNKFVGLENGDPEVNDESLDNGVVSVNVRLTRNCTECSNELKEYTFEFQQEHADELNEHNHQAHPNKSKDNFDDFELSMNDFEAEEGGGSRYKKNMISVSGSYSIKCTTCDTEVAKGEVKDETNAGSFDECY